MPYENAHAAGIDENGNVHSVIVIPYCNDNHEDVTAYCNSVGLEGTWLDCSYLGSRRGRYPGPGDRYDAKTDTFLPSDASNTQE